MKLKRFLSLLLCVTLLTSILQVSTMETGVYADDGAPPPETPSGIEPGTRVYYEVLTTGKADYEMPRDAVVRFTLANPGDEAVYFTYEIISGSASVSEHIESEQPKQGTVSFAAGETVKDMTIDIAPLMHSPTEYGLISDPEEYWTGDRAFFLYCTDIQNALFAGDSERATVSVPIENDFDYGQIYQSAADTYLFDLSSLSGVQGFPETPGKYQNTDDEIRISVPIEDDVRTLIDIGAFTHIDLPTGYISNENEATGAVSYQVDKNGELADGRPVTDTALNEFLALEGKSEIPFGGNRAISEVGLGRVPEGNLMAISLDFTLDYSSVTDAVYTYFGDTEGNYPQNQVRFSDNTAPFIEQAGISSELLPKGVRLGDMVPITVRYNEPVHTGNITANIGGETFDPIEGPDTISESVTFLYEADEDLITIYGGSLPVTDITGASDLSGKQQTEAPACNVSIDVPFDAEKAFTYCAQPYVAISQSVSLQASGTITVPLKNYMELSNWLSDNLDEEEVNGEGDSLVSVVKAKVIGFESEAETAVDVPLYAHIVGGRITELTGEFAPPVNQSGQARYYGAEIHLDADADGPGGFEPVYGLTVGYTVHPIIFIDSAEDIEIIYVNWPEGNTVFADNPPLSLGYSVNVNATWQRPEDFSWSSSNEAVAAINPEGVIALTGMTGTVTFTLTASNAGMAGSVSITSRILTVTEAGAAFLSIPAGMQNVEVLKGNDAKVFYSTNIPARNDAHAGSGTVTELTFRLYEAQYADEALTKGSLIHTDTRNAIASSTAGAFAVPKEYLSDTSAKGTYSYILEVSARDLGSDTVHTTDANICVRPLPARAILAKPESFYMTDETPGSPAGFSVSFDIENKAAGMEYLLTVKRNNESEPVFSTSAPGDAGETQRVPVDAVDGDRLFDAYTVSLKAKNEFDEAWSSDSYIIYVYNTDALKIAVNGGVESSWTMRPDQNFFEMTSIQIINNYRDISYTDRVSINKDSYQWSNIADKITWEVGDEGKLTLKFNRQYIGGEDSPLLLPGTVLDLEGHESGSTYVTATHALTGMKATIPVTIDDLRDRLYIFQTWPEGTCEVTYTNGQGVVKTVQTDSWGRLGVYEERGIRSDVVFRPIGDTAELYDTAVLYLHQLSANQHTGNRFDLYPQNTVKLPKLNYRMTFELFEQQTGEPYTGDIIIRGGVWVNEEYRHDVIDGYWRPITTINGKRGDADQGVEAEKGLYTLNFNSDEFADNYGRLLTEDELEYVVEVKFPGNSHYPQFIKVDNETIRKNKNSPLGVYLKEAVRKVGTSLIQNGAIVSSQTLTIDGKEYPISEKAVLSSEPKSITLDMSMIITSGDYGSKYTFRLLDEYDWMIHLDTQARAEAKYEFSDTVVLSGKINLTPTLLKIRPGQSLSLYPSVLKTNGSLKLSKPIMIQKLYNIPNMSEIFFRSGGVPELSSQFYNIILSPDSLDFDGNDELVRDMLDTMSGFSFPYPAYRLEITPTDDPLVYKGIIRFAVGSYSRENPSGIFVAEDESIAYNFMPGFSDMKEMKKGEYLANSRKAMEDAKYGRSGYEKSYGGGAYMECEIRYDVEKYVWKIKLLKSDMFIGGGVTYYYTQNGWVAFVPVTATFKTGMTGELGLKTVYDSATGTRAYIYELRPYFFVYGFGGVGFDYEIVALKVGPYGMISHDQRYLWYKRENDVRNGQKLTIEGEVGVEFLMKLLFVEVNGQVELGGFSKSWTYNDFNAINSIFSSGKVLRMLAGGASSESDGQISGTMAFEDRSYLDDTDRNWGSAPDVKSGLKGFAALADDGITVLLPDAYPYSDPVLTEDGKMMVYLHDMGSTDIMDTAVNFTIRDDTEEDFPEGAEIAPAEEPENYPDSSVSAAGTRDNAVAVWTRMFADPGVEAGGEAATEDIVNMFAGTEIMAAVYDPDGGDGDGGFTTTRLTANSTPDMAPVVAVSGDKAVAAWRSVAMSDLENPLDFSGRDEIMYSIYDGAGWSRPKVLYNGSIDHVNTLNAAMLSDGTAAVTYQITENGTTNSEIICAVLDEDGEVKNSPRLTNNDTPDTNPQITSAVFPDGTERFVIGWNGQNNIRLSAVSGSGDLYTEFEREIGNASDGSDYSGFRFVKGAQEIGDLSVVWKEPNTGTADENDDIYRDAVWGIKLIKEAGDAITQSGKLRLLELVDHNTVDSLDAVVNPATGEINFALLLSDHSGGEAQANLAVARSGYRNEMIADQPWFSYEDILPGLEMPVLFRVENSGAEPIYEVDIELGGVSGVFDEDMIRPGEYKEFTVFYTVPDPVVDPAYSITSQFGASPDSLTSLDSTSGVLKMNLPDVGIEQLTVTREAERERDFSVLLRNNAYSGLVAGRHTVRLEVYDTSDFENGTPIAAENISDAEGLDTLNNGTLPLSITLSGTAIEGLLDEEGEIPKNGAYVFFNAVLEEDGIVTEDADIGNDTGYVMVHSLLEKNGIPVSIASLTEWAEGQTTVRVEALNNSMNSINNGNIIVSLKDENGNVLTTQQTFDPSDTPGSLVSVAGEETGEASFLFDQAGTSADVLFSRIDEGGTKLSVLRMRGVPLDFDRDVYQYDLETTGLTETSITAVAENPASVVTAARNGRPVSISEPCPLSYGMNTFVITVTTGTDVVTYTVKVQNAGGGDNSGTTSSGDNAGTPASSHSVKLILNGIERKITVRVEGDKAVISLGELAEEIFTGSGSTVLTIPPIPGVNAYTLEMPAGSLSGQYGKATLTVNTSLGSTTIPSGMLSGMEGLEGKKAGIAIAAGDKSKLPDDVKTAIGDRPLISLTLSIDGKQTDWSNPNAPVTVSIPYTPTAAELADPESIIIWYIDGSGNAVCVPNGRYDPATGMVTFGTTHFSDYAVAYNKVSFKDVAADAWYNKAVSFIASRGITTGTGNGNYSPAAKLTRGELLVMLMKAYGIAPETNLEDNFSDASNTYYTGYLAAAKRLGITAGMGNNQYVPGKEITRQEMFTMLYNALNVISQLPKGDSGKTLSDFTDAGDIAVWAKEAMMILVETGIVGGSNEMLTPISTTTRAEMAQVLYNLSFHKKKN